MVNFAPRVNFQTELKLTIHQRSGLTIDKKLMVNFTLRVNFALQVNFQRELELTINKRSGLTRRKLTIDLKMAAGLAPIAAASFFCHGKSQAKKDTAESGKKLLKRKEAG